MQCFRSVLTGDVPEHIFMLMSRKSFDFVPVAVVMVATAVLTAASYSIPWLGAARQAVTSGLDLIFGLLAS